MSRRYVFVVAPLLLIACVATAQTQPRSSLDERTFFGFTMNGVTPRKGWNNNVGFRVGSAQMWDDEFRVDQERGPVWVTEPMRVNLYMTADGVIREATFRLNTFKSLGEQITPAIRKQRIEELVDRISEKLGAKPSTRQPMRWKLLSLDARAPRIETEEISWIRPWGEVALYTCSYQSYPYYHCGETDYAPALLIQTNEIQQNYREAIEAGKKSRQATDAQRSKM